MNAFLCWLDGFAGTWLDPAMWGVRLRTGATIRYSGHIHGEPVYRVVGDREYEWHPCIRCGARIAMGWRSMP